MDRVPGTIPALSGRPAMLPAAAAGTALNHSRRVCFSDATLASGGSLARRGGRASVQWGLEPKPVSINVTRGFPKVELWFHFAVTNNCLRRHW